MALVERERISPLNERGVRTGRYVLYWMQQSQRSEQNHALEYAVDLANKKDLPVVVLFCLTDTYPDANLRHYTFMLEGLEETRAALALRGIRMVVARGHPPDVTVRSARDAACVVCDRGYLRHQKLWRRLVADNVPCLAVQVESDVVVPVRVVSGKAEFAARTIRPRIMRNTEHFLHDVAEVPVRRPSLDLDIGERYAVDPETIVENMDIDRSVSPVTRFFRGGTSRARELFGVFVRDNLARYAHNSNQPQTDDISHMSPYLHFGQISPVWLARELLRYGGQYPAETAAYLEQLIVRRELAMNFVEYTPDYDSLTCLPAWAQKTLNEHARDVREHRYTLDDLERARTHDDYWNAAMNEMRITGFMHNYMRMYWGKKVLEWSDGPEEAYRRLILLNNRYFLDGRDANSYTGVTWIFGLHDRAWQEREVFGKVRYMAASGLERKCDIASYVRKIDALIGPGGFRAEPG